MKKKVEQERRKQKKVKDSGRRSMKVNEGKMWKRQKKMNGGK